MKATYLLLFCLLVNTLQLCAQTVWQNPLKQGKNVIGGRALPEQIGQKYQRLADGEQAQVRKEVWDLSQNTAGLYLEFKTNADKIEVRYTTKGMRAMSHMPATGVSGVDLYLKNEQRWNWTAGQYNFKDTITYSFSNIPSQSGNYRLYLPLYTGVNWLEIGVDSRFKLDLLPQKEAIKPIIVYGTSIAQGGCASRPGLAWPAILGRKINEPIVNLGFSGNGRLEKPIVDVMANQPAKLFILDCMPNLGSKKLYPEEEIRTRVNAAVTALQAKQPNTPILLVEHSGGNENQLLDTARNGGYRFSSALLNKVYRELIAKGKKNIHLLTTKEIGFTSESTVDGAHPNDIGMMENAIAVEKAYRKIFKAK